MKSRAWRLPLAALLAFACVISPTFADDGIPLVLTWSPPEFNDDGSPWSDLAGYYVYTGNSPDTLIPSYFTNWSVPAIVLRYPPGSVHYFGVTAVSVNGIESTMTPVVSTLVH